MKKKESENESNAAVCADNNLSRSQSKIAHSRGLFFLEMWSG